MISNEALATPSGPTAPLDKELSAHVGSVLRELNTVRIETQRLVEQRRQLEVYLAALKTELETMRAEKVQLMAERIQIAPDTASAANDLDLVGTALPTPVTARITRSAPDPEHRSPMGGPSPVDEDAFKAFLQADEDHDKSREWFMSEAV